MQKYSTHTHTHTHRERERERERETDTHTNTDTDTDTRKMGWGGHLALGATLIAEIDCLTLGASRHQPRLWVSAPQQLLLLTLPPRVLHLLYGLECRV